MSTVELEDRTAPDVPVRRVLIIDDHRTFADLLGMALSTQPDLQCVGVAASAQEGVAAARELEPDLVVVDISMPERDGLSAAREIALARPGTLIAVVSAHQDPMWVSRARAAGAAAYIPKTGALGEVLEVLRRACPGQMAVPAELAESVAAAGPQEPAPALTPREAEVLDRLGRGMAPKQISRELGISVHTCRSYVKSLLAKFEVNSTLEAVVRAQQLGLL